MQKLTLEAVVTHHWEDLGTVFEPGEHIEVNAADVRKAEADPSVDWLVGVEYTGYYGIFLFRIPLRSICLLEAG